MTPAVVVGPRVSDDRAKTLADVLDRMAAATQSLMDSGHPSDERVACPMCHLSVVEAREHEPWCGWRIAYTSITPSDVQAVQRLARTLRYVGGLD